MIIKKTAVGLLFLLSFLSGSTQTVFADNNETVNSFDFEGNDSQSWAAFGTSTVISTNENAYSGECSLKISNRNEGWNGPSYNIFSSLTAGNKYDLSLQVFNASDSEDAFSATLKNTIADGTEDYLYIGSAACNPNEWTTLSGSFTFTDTMTSALLYIESKATGDFYIDNVTVSTSDIIISDNTQNDSQTNDDQNTKSDDESPDISENITEDKDTNINKAEIQNNAEDNSSADPMKEVLSHTTNISRNKPDYNFTFEQNDKFSDNFYALNKGRLIRNKDHAGKGSYSLLLTERTSDDSGLALSLDFLKRNTDYAVSANVFYEGNDCNDTNDFSLCLGFFKGNILKKQVINKTSVQKDEWTKLDGTFTIPSDGLNPFIYIVSEKDINNSDSYIPVSFYIDDFSFHNISSSYIKTFVIILAIIIILVVSGLLIYFSKFKKNILSPDKQTLIEDIDPETKVRTRDAYNRDVIFMIANPQKTVGKYIAVFDINSFKTIEKLYGKKKSGQALKRCSDILLSAADNQGTIYRTGNNEFVCISDTDLEIQFSRAISIECSKYLGYPLLIAQGYDKYDVEKDGAAPDIRNIIRRADEKMCINKENQKNSHSSLE